MPWDVGAYSDGRSSYWAEMAHGLIALAGVAGVAAGAAYLDAKLHIAKDLNTLSRARKGEENFARAGKISMHTMAPVIDAHY